MLLILLTMFCFHSTDSIFVGNHTLEKSRKRTEAEWICTRCRLPAEGSYCTRCGQIYEKPIK